MVNSIYASLPTTVFAEMSGLAAQLGAINLGQGYPDDPGPEAVRAKAADAVLNGYNQYPPMTGLVELRQAVAAHYGRTQGLDLDWASEVTITSGATEALAVSFLGLIEPGDEVIVFQPFYDSYLPVIRRAGGVPKLVTLKPPHWRFDRAMLEAVFSDRTRLVVLNNPMNPTGVVLPDEDLALLAEFCVAHDAVVVCDEVWEQVVFSGAVHLPLVSFPGMRERTVKIGSAGKMFGLTGWKVGYLCAAPALTHALTRAHQFLTFTTLCIDLKGSGIGEGDRAFCLRAVKEAGVAAIPVSAFYETEPVTSIVRLCFSKGDDTLDEGVRRLARARELSRLAATAGK